MNKKKFTYNSAFLISNARKTAFLVFLLLSGNLYCQQLSSSIDTTRVKIGEQIDYTIQVEADSSSLVVFPQGQTFAPMEVIDEGSIDTTFLQEKFRLIKKYGLTQFDSGTYTIPRQKIVVADKVLYTDSTAVKILDVVVDTTKQKMYDIKPIVAVEKNYFDFWKKLLWGLLALAIIGTLIYWFVFRKRPLSEEEKEALLPPFDRALLELKKLEDSQYLIKSEYKEYYSELTDIVRSYLEEEVHVSALESTTDELIEKLELLKDSGNLELEEDTIEQFKKVLKTADLVKFAKSQPETKVAESDRNTIENVVRKTKEAIPEPTEEELLLDEEYLEELEKKKRRKRIYTAIGVGAFVIFFGIGSSIAYYGVTLVKDTILGHPTKELLESEWVTSEYGYPPIFIETPKVLKRIVIKLPPEAKEVIKEQQMFGYESKIGLFSALTSSVMYNNQEEPNFEGAIAGILKELENQGAKNIVQKQEEFTTKSGVAGIKTYGSGTFKLPNSEKTARGKYIIFSFGGKGFMQQILLSWKEGDNYAEKIIDRITTSIDVKTES